MDGLRANRGRPWIVVANQSEARIYTVESARGPLIEVTRLANPEAQQHERDLVADRPGRAFDSAGEGRHAMGPEVDAKEQEAIRFAKEIAHEIDQGRTADRFERLILVAGPQFLGKLRSELSSAAEKLVDQEIGKNLAQLDAREIREHLPERV